MIKSSESLSSNLPESSVNRSMKNMLAGNPKRAEQLMLAQLSADKSTGLPESADRYLEISASLETMLNQNGLSINKEQLNSLTGAQEQDIQSKIDQASSLFKTLQSNEITEAISLATDAIKQGLPEISFPSVGRRKEVVALASIIIALIMVGILFTSVDAATPTVTPTPTEQVGGDEESLIPTATPTPEKVKLPTVTPTPEVVQEIVTSVTTDNVNARTGPGTSFGVEIVIPQGTEVVRLGEPQNGWVQISFVLDGKEYGKTEELYVSVTFLTEPETTTVTPEPQPEIEEEPEAPPITETETITNSTVMTGEVDTEAVGGTTSSVIFDATGFPTSELVNGEFKAVETLSSTEFAALNEIKGQELIKELPKQVAYGLEDGRIVVKPIAAADISSAKFAITEAGIFVSLNMNETRQMVMKWEGNIEYRADWKIVQFEGERVSLAISSAYNDIHPVFEDMIEGEKQYLLAIHNGTVEEALASEKRKKTYVNNPETFAWFHEIPDPDGVVSNYIEENPTPIGFTPGFESSIKFDTLAETFWNRLSGLTTDGKVNFSKLDKIVDTTQKVQITVWRFPDDEEAKLRWEGDEVSTLPDYFYQVDEKTGALVIHVSLMRTKSNNLSAVVSGAFGSILQKEFGIEPDDMDGKVKPMYWDINNSIVDIVKVGEDEIMVLPVYTDVGEEETLTWNKDN